MLLPPSDPVTQKSSFLYLFIPSFFCLSVSLFLFISTSLLLNNFFSTFYIASSAFILILIYQSSCLNSLFFPLWSESCSTFLWIKQLLVFLKLNFLWLWTLSNFNKKWENAQFFKIPSESVSIPANGNYRSSLFIEMKWRKQFFNEFEMKEFHSKRPGDIHSAAAT